MKTLIIHPYDPTTVFVKEFYEDLGWTAITDPRTPKKEIQEAIQEHDRIFMIGHGTTHGLITRSRTFVGSDMVQFLMDKECIFIWCNADIFVEKYGLKGLYTGMMISESEEAHLFDVPHTQKDIKDSNDLMMKAFRESVDSGNMLQTLKEIYNSGVYPDNEIIKFNEVRFYHTDNPPLKKPLNYSIGAMSVFLMERIQEDPEMVVSIIQKLGLPMNMMIYDRFFKVEPEKELV